MSRGKRYYWLKLKENFFDSDEIMWLEKQENGQNYVILYLKLLLKTMNTGGKLVFKLGGNTIPYDLNDISKFTRIDIDTVIVAMNLFVKIGLVEQSEEILTLPNSIEMTGSESDSAKRMRKLRDSKKSIKENEEC